MARVASPITLMPAASPKPVAASRLKLAIVDLMPRTTGVILSRPAKVVVTVASLPNRPISASGGAWAWRRLDQPHECHDVRGRLLQVAPRPTGVMDQEVGICETLRDRDQIGRAHV